MERYKTINEFVAESMSDKITKRAQSPLLGILLLLVGVAMLVALRVGALTDSLQAALLTLGLIALAVGIVLSAMCLTKSLWHYRYQPTHASMKSAMCYLSLADYQLALESLRARSVEGLTGIAPVVSSNNALSILYRGLL